MHAGKTCDQNLQPMAVNDEQCAPTSLDLVRREGVLWFLYGWFLNSLLDNIYEGKMTCHMFWKATNLRLILQPQLGVQSRAAPPYI